VAAGVAAGVAGSDPVLCLRSGDPAIRKIIYTTNAIESLNRVIGSTFSRIGMR
jgi:transposase-like protein